MWHSLCSTAQNHHSKYDMWMAVKHKKPFIHVRRIKSTLIFIIHIFDQEWSNFYIWWGWLKKETFHKFQEPPVFLFLFKRKLSPSANRRDNMMKNSLVTIFVLPLHWIINNINFLFLFLHCGLCETNFLGFFLFTFTPISPVVVNNSITENIQQQNKYLCKFFSWVKDKIVYNYWKRWAYHSFPKIYIYIFVAFGNVFSLLCENRQLLLQNKITRISFFLLSCERNL